jgi:plasmid stabilization system protein ParE
MQIPAAPSIRLEFDQASLIEELAARRREDIRRRAFEDMDRDDVRQEKERKDEKDRDDHAAFLESLREAALADSKRIAEFTAQLDRYDAMTVEALQENERAAAEVRERIRAALDGAVQLPDGRHVFKTEDGTAVFDEHGEAVSPDEIRPEDIAESKWKFEAYWADRTSEETLAKQRQGLLALQERLDTAREKVGKGGLTNGDLDALENDIDAAMPPELRKAQENAPERAGTVTDPAGQRRYEGPDAGAVSLSPRPAW